MRLTQVIIHEEVCLLLHTYKNFNSNVKLYKPEKCASFHMSQVLFISGPAPTSHVWNLFVEDRDIFGVSLVATAFSLALCEKTK